MRSSSVRTWIVPFFIILLTAHVGAVPPLPAEFYGSVLVDGQPAPAGTVITAQIQGVDRGSLSTEIAGFYGGPGLFEPRLKVNVSEEEYRPGEMTIVFIINGQQAVQNAFFEAGNSQQLDLSAGTGADNRTGSSPHLNLSGVSQTDPVMRGIPLNTSSNPDESIEPRQSYDNSGSSDSSSGTILYGLDQPRVFSSDDGLAELSFVKDTMLFSPEGQFLNAVGLKSKNIADLPSLSPNQSFRFSGYAYEVIPSGTYFNPKGVLTLKLPPERAYELINAKPVIYEYLPQTTTWEQVNTNANVFTNVITADIFEAAIYGLYIPAPVMSGNTVNINRTTISPTGEDNQTINQSPFQSGSLQGVLPVITPQAVITPQETAPSQNISAPLASGSSEPMIITPGSTNQGDGNQPAVQEDTRIQPIPVPTPISDVVSPENSKFGGPVFIIIGLLVLLIIGNVAVYAVYQYWWLHRERNG